VVEKAFHSWNDPDANRRLNRVQLLIDVPDDYEPQRQIRTNATKRPGGAGPPTAHAFNSIARKKNKATGIKCANRCGKLVSSNDPLQSNAILCCYQNEYYDWIEEEDCCRRWLCNCCRLKQAISIDTKSWFCEDHDDMYERPTQNSPMA
jgi:hypothetical protein